MELHKIFNLLIAAIRTASLNIPPHLDYYFLTHTFSNLTCDPYANQTPSNLALECSVLGPRTTPTSSFKIVWHRTLENTSTTQNLSDLSTNKAGMVNIDELKISISEIVIVRSILTVSDLDTSNVSGEYWCTVEEQQKTMNVLMSTNQSISPLTLHSSSVYQGLEACPDGIIHTVMADGILNSSSSSSSTSSSSSSFATSAPPSSSLSTTSAIDDENGMSGNWDVTWIIALSVIVGVLVFAVHVLLLIVGCLCCMGKWRGIKKYKESLPFHQSTTSLVSSSSPPRNHRISLTTSSLISPSNPITQSAPSTPPSLELAKPPNYPPPKLTPPPPKVNLPSPKLKTPPTKLKLPLLPLFSMLPSRLMDEVMPLEMHANQFQEQTYQPSLHRRRAMTVASDMSYCIAYQEKPKMIPFCDISGIHASINDQGQILVSSPSNDVTDDIYAAPNYVSNWRRTFDHNSISSVSTVSSDVTAIINHGTHTPPDENRVSLCFNDKKMHKYESLNLETMDSCTLYDSPTYAKVGNERDEGADNEAENVRMNRNKRVQIAMEYAWLNLQSEVISQCSAMTESMDGEYVQPNDVVRTISTSPTNDELPAVELPDYISLS